MSTIRHFKIFVTVYQQRSITKAANHLHLAQPSVSLAIKELEKEYQIQLFERISRKIYPTYYGDQFYQHALHIVSTFDTIELGVRKWKEHEHITIGSSITIATCFLPAMIADFQKEFNHLQIKLRVRNASCIEQDILDNKIDFAFVEGMPHFPNINKMKIWEDQLVLVFHPSHPLAKENNEVLLAMAANYPLLCREKGSASRDALEALFSLHNLNVNATIESVSNQVIIEGLQHNLGVAILPYSLVRTQILNKMLGMQSLVQDEYKSQWYIIWHQQKYLSEQMQAFINKAKQLCQEGI